MRHYVHDVSVLQQSRHTYSSRGTRCDITSTTSAYYSSRGTRCDITSTTSAYYSSRGSVKQQSQHDHRQQQTQIISMTSFHENYTFSTFTTRQLGGNSVAHNKVALRRVRLVLRWVTVQGSTVLLCNSTPWSTQPPTFSGTGNKYQSRRRGSRLWLQR